MRYRLPKNGIGDVVVGACVVQGAQDPTSEFIVRDHLMPWASRLEGQFIVKKESDVDGNDFLDIGLNTWEKVETPTAGAELRHILWAKSVGVQKPLMVTMKQSPEDEVEWVKNYLVGNTVLLAPFSAWASREWPLYKWHKLQDMLINEGFSVVAVGASSDEERLKMFNKFCWGFKPPRVIELIRQSICIISNDSGLAHLAAIERKPTIVVCAPTRGQSVFGFYPTVRTVQSATPCSPCYWQGSRGWRRWCDEYGCNAFAELRCDEVLSSVNELLAVQYPIKAEHCIDKRTGKINIAKVKEYARITGIQTTEATIQAKQFCVPCTKISK